MNVVEQHSDILQNIEFAIVSTYRERPELRDPEVIMALEKLITYYTRMKKGLPQLPVVLPEGSMAVFTFMKAVCESRREGGEEDATPDESLPRVPLRIIVLCLERLLDSARNWHKRDGQRGYLNFVAQYIV